MATLVATLLLGLSLVFSLMATIEVPTDFFSFTKSSASFAVFAVALADDDDDIDFDLLFGSNAMAIGTTVAIAINGAIGAMVSALADCPDVILPPPRGI